MCNGRGRRYVKHVGWEGEGNMKWTVAAASKRCEASDGRAYNEMTESMGHGIPDLWSWHIWSDDSNIDIDIWVKTSARSDENMSLQIDYL